MEAFEAVKEQVKKKERQHHHRHKTKKWSIAKFFFTVTFFSSSFQDDRQLSKETGLCACLPNSTVYVTREKMSILIDSGMKKIGSWNYVLEKS